MVLAGACAALAAREPASRPGPSPAARFQFKDVAPEAGLTRIIHAGRPGKDHLLDSTGSGAAWIDYDRDGWLDVYLVNGWKLDGSGVVEKGRNALYRNRRDGTFEDVTGKAGVEGEGSWGGGATVADYDADGWPDILITAFGPNVLYRNRGDGTFVNVAAKAGVELPGWNAGAAFFDAEGDGDLDLYVSAYIDCTLEEVLRGARTMDWKGVEKVALGPFGLKGAADHFLLSDGKGAFRDATEAAGLADRALAYGFGVRAADLDDDGDIDLYVANDSDANYVYRNEGNGTFRDVGLWSGAALSGTGAAQAGMGVAAGDADGDGRLDLLVTNFSEDFSTLYRGDGKGFFEDVSERSGVGPATYKPLSWGTALSDLDNDMDLDIVIANGHIYPQVDAHPEFGMSYAQTCLLLENDGAGRFTDVSAAAGPGFAGRHAHRGLAAGDYDNDGDLDLLITRLDEPPALLRNDLPAAGSWLILALESPPGKGPSLGARVRVTAGGKTLLRDLAAGDSFLSTHDPRAHFGLGTATMVDRIEVRWPDGTTTVREKLPVNQIVKLVKGS